MIARDLLFACALAICFATLSTVTGEDDVFIYSVHLDKQTELIWAIKRSRLVSIPPWREAVEETPLSPHRAVTAATEYLQSSVGIHGATVVRILLIRIGHDSDNHWA